MAYDMCPGAAAGEKWRQLVSIPYLREPESATVSTCRADGLELLSLWRGQFGEGLSTAHQRLGMAYCTWADESKDSTYHPTSGAGTERRNAEARRRGTAPLVLMGGSDVLGCRRGSVFRACGGGAKHCGPLRQSIAFRLWNIVNVLALRLCGD